MTEDDNSVVHEADETGWEIDPADESALLMVATGRQIELWREDRGMTRVDLAEAMGYTANFIYRVEKGLRIPRPEFLDRLDEELEAGGKISAMKQDLAQARYPKKIRNIVRLERDAVEICTYNNCVIDGLLQTEDYVRAVLRTRRPPFREEELERRLSDRLARQKLLHTPTAVPFFSYVLCESTLRRPIGGRMVMRKQLEHLLEISQLRNVDLQVLPLNRAENSGLDGPFRLLKLKDGKMVGLYGVQLTNRVVTDVNETQTLDLRYGAVRAQALTPRESLSLIEKALGDT
ncbi:helix-turn-helix domain-containing protein [Streptomyces gamaensis]|uniref:Helix-turn-helix domain-containing protein n=1 Tax=Streptomyces gamaensis TaxID=1763542 RepID=A0ABW0Z5H0_9ACTN